MKNRITTTKTNIFLAKKNEKQHHRKTLRLHILLQMFKEHQELRHLKGADRFIKYTSEVDNRIVENKKKKGEFSL